MKRITETKRFTTIRKAFDYLTAQRNAGKDAYYVAYVWRGRVVYEVEIYGEGK